MEEFGENVYEAKFTEIALVENENSYKCNSCIVYIVLFVIFFTINVTGIGASFIYFHKSFKKDVYSWNKNLLNL